MTREERRRKLSPETRRRRRTLALVAIAAAAVIAIAVFGAFVPFDSLLPAYSVPPRREGEMRFHFLDVGQGDCTVVEFPDGETLVVDAGDGTADAVGHIVRYLKGLHPVRVSMLLTHPDLDHYGGFSALLNVFGAERFYLPVYDADAREYRALKDEIAALGCRCETLARYGGFGSGCGAYMSCISPYAYGEGTGNDASAVLYFAYEGARVLLCADISAVRERLLVREYALDGDIFSAEGREVRLDGIDVVKAAHHGSSDSSSQEWLSLLRPAHFVVSCGRDNGYSHPSGEALARLRAASPQGKIYRTDELGDVMFSVYEGKITVSTDRK